jgi:hypothetical protein
MDIPITQISTKDEYLESSDSENKLSVGDGVRFGFGFGFGMFLWGLLFSAIILVTMFFGSEILIKTFSHSLKLF